MRRKHLLCAVPSRLLRLQIPDIPPFTLVGSGARVWVSTVSAQCVALLVLLFLEYRVLRNLIEVIAVH